MPVGRIEVAEVAVEAVVERRTLKAEHVHWCAVYGTGRRKENKGWQEQSLIQLGGQTCSRTRGWASQISLCRDIRLSTS